MDYMSWMSQTSAIHSTFLSNICLPATHDSGTYNLTDILTQGLDADERTIIRSLSEIACQVIDNQSIPKSDIFEYVSNPFQWLYNTVIPFVNGLMTATGQKIGTQLKCLCP